jgi:hypothetical protein
MGERGKLDRKSELADAPGRVVSRVWHDRTRHTGGAWLLTGFLLSGLQGCDQLGIETPQRAAERSEAEAKAIGSACRHAMRAIEDCYTLNPKADKSAMFGGWREMDEYMRENKLEGIAPVVPRPPPPQAASKASAPASAASKADEEEDAEDPPPKKASKGKGH